jgi:hypothetical protein
MRVGVSVTIFLAILYVDLKELLRDWDSSEKAEMRNDFEAC